MAPVLQHTIDIDKVEKIAQQMEKDNTGKLNCSYDAGCSQNGAFVYRRSE
jgi:hypothetical protein